MYYKGRPACPELSSVLSPRVENEILSKTGFVENLGSLSSISTCWGASDEAPVICTAFPAIEWMPGCLRRVSELDLGFSGECQSSGCWEIWVGRVGFFFRSCCGLFSWDVYCVCSDLTRIWSDFCACSKAGIWAILIIRGFGASAMLVVFSSGFSVLVFVVAWCCSHFHHG